MLDENEKEWITEKAKRAIAAYSTEYVSGNMDILLKPFYEDLQKVIREGGDVSKFISEMQERRSKKILSSMVQESSSIALYTQKINQLSEQKRKLEGCKVFAELGKELVDNLYSCFPKGKAECTSFAIDLFFGKNPEIKFSLKDRLFNQKKISQFQQAVQNIKIFMENNNVVKAMNDNEDPAGQFMRKLLSSTDRDRVYDEYMRSIDGLLKEKSQSIETYEDKKKKQEEIDQEFILKCKEADSSKILEENKYLDEYVSYERQLFSNSRQLNVSDYVERLENIKDDEKVLFNISVKNNGKIEKICESLGIDLGRVQDISKWYLQSPVLNGSNLGELWSPVMTAKEAKEIVPKLVDYMDKADISDHLVIPMKAEEVFQQNESKDMLADDVRLAKFWDFISMIGVRYPVFTWGKFDDDVRRYAYELAGEEPRDLSVPPKKMGSAPSSLKRNIMDFEEEFPREKYLFSGTQTSDDYLFLSKRVGRNGTLYASSDITYAQIYDGVGSGKGIGVSATNDTYKPINSLGKIGKDDVYVGFINVYEGNESDKFYSNFGIDSARCRHVTQLTREEGIYGYDQPDAMYRRRDTETFITPEKNPLKDKILHFCVGNMSYFIKLSVVADHPFVQDLLQARRADPKYSFSKAGIYERFSKQKESYLKDKEKSKGIDMQSFIARQWSR